MKKVTRIEMIASVKRELAMRKTVYPKRVQAGKMKQELADHETNCMQAVFNTLMALEVPEVSIGVPADALSLLQAFQAEYDAFCRQTIGVGAKVDMYEMAALEEIIAYLKKNATDKSNHGVLSAWRFIFLKWDRVGAFIGKQKSLSQINKNLVEILDKIRNGHDKKSAAKNSRDLYKQGLKEQ